MTIIAVKKNKNRRLMPTQLAAAKAWFVTKYIN